MKQVYYADSSVLVKRHVEEIGSSWFRELALPYSGNSIVSTKLSIIEVFSAFNRRKRETTIGHTDYSDFAKDFIAASQNEYDLLDLNDAIIIEAQRLLETYQLRTGDAAQLATAIYVRNLLFNSQLAAPIFLASDTKLLNAAAAEGFATENPLLHP